MERKKIEELIKKSLDKFFEYEQDLIDIDVNERSISHKIAEYIQKEFPDWNVDCEYNGDEEHHPKLLRIDPENIQTDDTNGKTVYPDIIIHKRRKKKENLLIIEIKRSGLDYQFDIKKIKAFVNSDKYCYKFGLMLIINTTKESTKKYEWLWFP